METKIVLAMHNELSEAFLLAASHFVDTNDVICLSLLEGDTLDDYRDRIDLLLREFDNCLVLTDLLTGACTISFMQFLNKYPFSLVSGTNLVMLVEAIENKELFSNFELADLIIKKSKEDIQNCNQLIEQGMNGLNEEEGVL